ncbi:MAG: hypothetical protein IJU69_03305 [Bacteroidales bacterium]|nr:hypothetical protein [Bacteroidales bacterium]
MKAKNILLLAAFAATAFGAATNCSVDEIEKTPAHSTGYDTFYAELEKSSSKIYADAQLNQYFNEGDRISVFNENTFNQRYNFDGKTGDTDGTFSVEGNPYRGRALQGIRAVYPYRENTSIGSDGLLKINYPSTQQYAQKTYGPGAVTMVCATKDDKLRFKNAAGILVIKLYGSNQTVYSINLSGRGGEKISGPATVSMKEGGLPAVSMNADAGKSVTLVCDGGVKLGSSEADYTEFWFTLPPIDFNGGICITVNGSGGKSFEKITSSPVSIKRSILTRMAPAKVELSSSGGAFRGGSGSEENPYLIGTAQDLVKLSEYISSESVAADYKTKCYRQIADIDMSSVKNFTPIGTTTSLNFRGRYDGDGHTISNLTINQTTVGKPAALFGMTGTNTQISGIRLQNLKIKSDSYYTGAIVGYEYRSKIENCSVVNAEITSTGAPADGTLKNCALTGGIAGNAYEGSIRGCKFSGSVYGSTHHVGGILGEAQSSDTGSVSVSDCEFSGSVSTAYYVGGIVGYCRGTVSITGCTCRGLVSGTGNNAGGITSCIGKGEISDCVFSGTAAVSIKGSNAGGIAGWIYGSGDAVIKIDGCASYGTVRSLCSTGGILGLLQNNAGDSFTMINCEAAGCNVVSTGANSYKYQLCGGVCGYAQGAGNVEFINCIAKAESVSGVLAANGGIGGFTGYISQPNSFRNCAACTVASDILYNNAPITGSSIKIYGGFLGRATAAATLSDCHAPEGLQFGPSDGKEIRTGCSLMSTTSMTDGTLLLALNNAASAIAGAMTWVKGSDGYPTLSGIRADPDKTSGKKIRVSVIGDSISTFAGWQPNGYTNHYPNTNNCDVTSVDKTWWYRLIYQYMPSARLDMNLSFSNSTVTANSCGDATAYWYGHDFCSRYIECGGMGNPDVILIHGGTNDYTHNYGECLAGNIPMRSASLPAASIMNPLYAAADACTTLSQAKKLDSSTFCAAYIKLIRMMQLQYPSAKIVCVVGDFIGSSDQPALRLCILDIVKHYNTSCRAADLVAASGWRCTTAPFTKYSGSHPDAAGMDYMASTIYSKVKDWVK